MTRLVLALAAMLTLGAPPLVARQTQQPKSLMPRSLNPPDEDVAARLAEIPPDTRDLTAQVFGDPLPGRSALDRRTAV